ncbi:M99 family carboxypeptidase catalytic domain-containing protein [uncultured Arcobacter sp.]|uniref:M99 family carboxypeptidase catalytic domain-containing protein n=1 Tax=uncultured Arcobacter sp. TaxID=165434 RepID=UPI002620931C|nr:M99 family carboxypeptidase catalytic domain-containing protein [uncultured Arcobacter sp.]
MLKLFRFLFIFILLQNLHANSSDLNFKLIKKGIQDENTLLIVGGIQGDEPGGFMAASLIATHYEITKGSVWIVPNLNFNSIIQRSRGPFGDMNRKFAYISEEDPDYIDVKRIKELIKKPEVKLILNLHDGSGYFRNKYIDKDHSPYKWGQSSIIDQSSLNVPAYGNLEEIGKRICKKVNESLIREEDIYHLHNTKTKLGDKEMEKTLTYYAINNGKAAFGNEASKELPVHERTYYHLLALEEYMNIMGIEFKRKFDLEPIALRNVIDNDIYISFYNDKIKLPLSEVRSYIGYFPVKKDGTIDFKPSSPVMTVIKNSNSTYAIHYGNRRLSVLEPDYLEVSEKKENIKFKIDGEDKNIEIGSLVDVGKSFYVFPNEYRVNVIGYVNKNFRNESGLNIEKDDIIKRFSLDRKGEIYRVEFYNKIDNKFAGMVLVKFSKKFYEELVSNEVGKVPPSL